MMHSYGEYLDFFTSGQRTRIAYPWLLEFIPLHLPYLQAASVPLDLSDTQLKARLGK